MRIEITVSLIERPDTADSFEVSSYDPADPVGSARNTIEWAHTEVAAAIRHLARAYDKHYAAKLDGDLGLTADARSYMGADVLGYVAEMKRIP